ncbi:ArsC family reductase [Kordiimonas marina]|uniref:ArsC family reductase n=1 Tax=Kordiimonas marina TaxID=2872312 RepID=UPI001FF19EEF|nr:ArsC family reductase [Kordiimonas marina]MCJ9429394.1 ArsC family reductase [Kordiimonas marina]
MIVLYGIKNCDTVKKARAWLEGADMPYHFHDFRVDGLNEAMMDRFIAALGWEALLNTRGTTWRKLPEEDRADMTEAKAAALMLAHEALIKRPVWEKDGEYRLGFAAKDHDALTDWVGI